MTDLVKTEEDAIDEATRAFEQEIGVRGVQYEIEQVGVQRFLKFFVGRKAPVYTSALYRVQQVLDKDNPFQGLISIQVDQTKIPFPTSLEAKALLILLTRSTREVSEGEKSGGYSVPYIPFQNGEDHKLSQPASHIVHGRRGVGKTTLIRQAVKILREKGSLTVVLDMQSYSTLEEEDLYREVLYDFCFKLAEQDIGDSSKELSEIAGKIMDGTLKSSTAPTRINRALEKLTKAKGSPVYLFLDDYHLVHSDIQPNLLHHLHAALKGAGGWLKVAGLSSLLNPYSPDSREGLQVPGDAQFISLDLTLENPEAAESHLRRILESFLSAVGHKLTQKVMSQQAFKRLVWATAGVPRDFLQMFARALEHAQKDKHSAVTVSDVNMAIGEFGQQKMSDLEQDARNAKNDLNEMLKKIKQRCLDENKINAFLVRSEDSSERSCVHALRDLRMIHLIHRSVTPDAAGEAYEAYILDYSIFTGFRRKRNIKEMIPKEEQFKVAELRGLPKIS